MTLLVAVADATADQELVASARALAAARWEVRGVHVREPGLAEPGSAELEGLEVTPVDGDPVEALTRLAGGAAVDAFAFGFWNIVNSECETANLHLPKCVRLVIIGGETATEAMFASWKHQHSHHPRLVNTYGPTEATVVATAFAYNPAVEESLSADRPAGWACCGFCHELFRPTLAAWIRR